MRVLAPAPAPAATLRASCFDSLVPWFNQGNVNTGCMLLVVIRVIIDAPNKRRGGLGCNDAYEASLLYRARKGCSSLRVAQNTPGIVGVVHTCRRVSVVGKRW